MSEQIKANRNLNAEDVTQASVASRDSLSLRPLAFIGLRNTLPSDVDIISPFVSQLMRFISRYRVADGSMFEIELALHEALFNAVIHGNQRDPRKRVYVNCRCATNGEVWITVGDEGNGFNHDMLQDPTSPDNRMRTSGRGVYLIRTLMDEVDFKEGGSVVHMRKRANADSDLTRKPQ